MIKYYKKLQQEIIKNIDSAKENRYQAIYQDNDNVYFTYAGFVAYCIPKCLFWLDYDKINKDFRVIDLTKCFDLNTIKKPNAKITGITFKTGKEVTIIDNGSVNAWVDSKLLKEFIGPCFEYAVQEEKKPIKVFLNGVLYAVICPINKGVSEEDLKK